MFGLCHFLCIKMHLNETFGLQKNCASCELQWTKNNTDICLTFLSGRWRWRQWRHPVWGWADQDRVRRPAQQVQQRDPGSATSSSGILHWSRWYFHVPYLTHIILYMWFKPYLEGSGGGEVTASLFMGPEFKSIWRLGFFHFFKQGQSVLNQVPQERCMFAVFSVITLAVLPVV